MGRLLLLALVVLGGCVQNEAAFHGTGILGPLEGTTGSGEDAETGDPGVDDDGESGSSSGGEFDVPSADVPCLTQFDATVRDFDASHPDFESDRAGFDPGIVQPTLGADRKPVYTELGGSPTTNGVELFDQWYRDVPLVNARVEIQLGLDEYSGAMWQVDDQEFFPLDPYDLGPDPGAHNHHFTLEIHAQFTYYGGEKFRFQGDDDLFLFVNERLVIDLGGVHESLGGEVVLDDVAADIGLNIGETYPLDLFFAERHTEKSRFRIETTIGCFQPQE